jgi:LCP family protein required for cell wall assembly
MKIYDISDRPKQPNLRQNPRKVVAIIFVAVIILLAGGAYAYVTHSLSHTSKSFKDGQAISVSSLLAAQNTTLAGESQDRTNVLIYGLTADGLRTDTIILASYYWNEHKLVMLNIPRDLYASYDGHTTKIVSLYSYAKNANTDPSYPPQYVSDFIEQEYGINIDYWVVANMDAFKQLVDAVGGVTVNVPDSFTDCEYPTDDYSGYIRPCPHFDAGTQTMDGATALIYARSRHAPGPEGTDFARSKRQQVIIEAILSKLKQQGALTDVSKLDSYLSIFGNNIFTDMTPAELIKASEMAGQLNLSQDIIMANWSNNIGFLCDSTDDGGSYVLRYGVPGDCAGVAGVDDGNPYRQQAITYVQNLLQSAEPATSTQSSLGTTTPDGE